MKRIQSITLGVLLSVLALFYPSVAKAAENTVSDNIISTRIDINMPENIGFVSRAGTTYDHTSGTKADATYKRVWGRTQAWQGNQKISSYTRARYEQIGLGTIIGDSGRQYSPTFGATSYAISGKCDNSVVSMYVGHTYYGV